MGLTPEDRCQCPGNEIHPCCRGITQEDLLCNVCRAVAKEPGERCAAILVPGKEPVHFGIADLDWLGVPRLLISKLAPDTREIP